MINEAAVKMQIPWIYGGCIGAEGQTLTVLPGEPPCFRCVMNEPPPPGTAPTCDTAGILAPIVNVIASFQACEAIKILSGNAAAVSRTLTIIDMWDNQVRQLNLDRLRSWLAVQRAAAVPIRSKNFPGSWASSAAAAPCCAGVTRCNWVTRPQGAHQTVNFNAFAEKLSAVGQVTRNPYLLRCAIGRYLITLFPDGRAIIGGTSDIAEARSVYAKYVGS